MTDFKMVQNVPLPLSCKDGFGFMCDELLTMGILWFDAEQSKRKKVHILLSEKQYWVMSVDGGNIALLIVFGNMGCRV